MKKGHSTVLLLLGVTVAVLVLCPTANAALVWGTDASGELIGSRTSPTSKGIQATDGWNNGGLNLSWKISNNDGIWTYQYLVNVNRKEVSHFILEVSQDGNPFNILPGTDTNITQPQIWNGTSAGNSNPLMPNEIYGIKFDFGGLKSTYTIVTDRAPVYGVFYAKDGKDSDENVVAWSNALNDPNYKTNTSFTSMDFIVRPDSTLVPIPGALCLLASGILGLAGLRRKMQKKEPPLLQQFL